MSKCEGCSYIDIVDWEQDVKTGKTIVIYWCKRYRELCSNIQECKEVEENE